MLTVKDAQTKILEGAKPTSVATISLESARGRVLAKDYISPINVPPEDNSAMDGYAVNSNDVSSIPITLPVSQRIPAGSAPAKHIPETTARIFTGGVLPSGADAVVMQEDCEQVGMQVLIKHAVCAGENVRHCGQDILKGTELFTQGHCLRPQDIGLLASVGIQQLDVREKPRVAVLGTGDELVEPGNKLKPGQIYNSNKFMLTALLQQLGCEVASDHAYGSHAVKDTLKDTVDALQSLVGKVDLILTSGGVSVGEEDYIKPAMETLGSIENWKIKLKPGKPLAYGHIGNTRMIGLPGNPVSSFVTFLLFVAPLLRKMQGLHRVLPNPQRLPLAFAIDKARQRPEFLRVKVENGSVQKFNNQSSGVLSSTVWADALAHIPEEQTFKAGDEVTIYFLNQLLAQDLS